MAAICVEHVVLRWILLFRALLISFSDLILQCDEAKPNCMRCQKSKRLCTGYRDAFELNLRDETRSTKKKISRMISHRSFVDGVSQFDCTQELINTPATDLRSTPMTATNLNAFVSFHMPSWEWPEPTYTEGHCSRSSLGSLSSITDFSAISLSGSESTSYPRNYTAANHTCISAHLSIPIDQQASCFFMSNFVLLPGQGVLSGYLNFLLPSLASSHANKALQTAFSAVALAALGTRPNSKALISQAHASYCMALNEINGTLRNPELAMSDTTLCAVLMLSFFEVS